MKKYLTAVLLVALIAGTVHADEYTIVPFRLGGLNEANFSLLDAKGLNDDGFIAAFNGSGTIYMTKHNEMKEVVTLEEILAFLETEHVIMDLSFGVSDKIQVEDINNAGQIIATFEVQDETFLNELGGLGVLLRPVGDGYRIERVCGLVSDCSAEDINDQGTIVGTEYFAEPQEEGGDQVGFYKRLTDDTTQFLQPPEFGTWAIAINNEEILVGGDAGIPGNWLDDIGFFYDVPTDAATEIEPIDPDFRIYPLDINRFQQIVGVAANNTVGPGEIRAYVFLWEDGAMSMELSPTSGELGSVVINDSGQLILEEFEQLPETSLFHPFIYDHRRGLQSLQDVIPEKIGSLDLKIDSLDNINNRGVILANGDLTGTPGPGENLVPGRYAFLLYPHFIRGDCNNSGEVDVADAITMLHYKFLGGQVLYTDACDADNNNEITKEDAIFLLIHLFLGGEDPAAPFPEPGPDLN